MKTAFLLLGLAATGFAANVVPDFLPPETRVVIGIRVRSLADSAALRNASQGRLSVGSEWLQAASKAGFDPLRDLDEVWIASSGEGGNAPTLAVIWGRFNLETAREHADYYRDVPLLRRPERGESVLAVLNSSIAVAGPTKFVKAAIDRRGLGKGLPADVAARIEPLRARWDIWGFGERPEGFASPVKGQPDGLQSLDRFQFGVSVKQGLELAGEAHARTAEDSAKLAAYLKMFQAMMPAQGPAKLDVRMEKDVLKLAVSIPEAELKKLVEQGVGRFAQGMGRSTPAPLPARDALPRVTGSENAPPAAATSDTGVFVLPGGR